MQSKDQKVFKGTFYQFDYEQDWEVEIIENIVCVFKEYGDGVLQFAATRSENGKVDLDLELLKYLKRNQIDHSNQKITSYITANGQNALALEYTKEGRFWLLQLLAQDDKLLVVIYNADAPPNESLTLEISKILVSIKFL